MEPATTPSRRLAPLCFALLLAAAGAGALATWIAVVPAAYESRPISVAGVPNAVAQCLSRELKETPELRQAPGGVRDAQAETVITILSDERTRATRLHYAGVARSNFVVTLSDAGNNRSTARLTILPAPNPASAIEAAVRRCNRS